MQNICNICSKIWAKHTTTVGPLAPGKDLGSNFFFFLCKNIHVLFAESKYFLLGTWANQSSTFSPKYVSQLMLGLVFFRPLHVAARNGLKVVVEELLAKGACVLAVDENGKWKKSTVTAGTFHKLVEARGK